MKILDKSMLSGNSKFIDFLSNSLFLIFVAFVFIFSFLFFLFKLNEFYLYKKDIVQYKQFLSKDLNEIKNYLNNKNKNELLIDDKLSKIYNQNLSQVSIFDIFKHLKELFLGNSNILIKKINRNQNELIIEGEVSNAKMYSITALSKIIENLFNYKIFKNINISNISKEAKDGVAVSDFKISIFLSPLDNYNKSLYTGKSLLNNVLLDINSNNNVVVDKLTFDAYKINDKYIIDLKWDDVKNELIDYYVLYIGENTQNMKLLDITKDNKYRYETFEKNKNIVFQVFTVDKNLNLSQGSNFINVNTSNIDNYFQVDNVSFKKEFIKNENNTLVTRYFLSWSSINNAKKYIILYSIDNKNYSLLNTTTNNSYIYDTYDMLNLYDFKVFYLK